MARLLLWGILLALALRAVSRFVRGLLDGAGYRRDVPGQSRSGTAVGLVRDPVCGTFVVPGRALTAGTGSGTRYFCSERCLEAWQKR